MIRNQENCIHFRGSGWNLKSLSKGIKLRMPIQPSPNLYHPAILFSPIAMETP